MAPHELCHELLPVYLRHWLVSRVLVAGLALVCFVNSCWGAFVFDDSEAILNNKDVDPTATSTSQVFAHDFWGTNISLETSHKSYRPLTVLTFRLSFWLAGGRHPFLFHLFNVALHPIVSLLLMEVASCWLSSCKNYQTLQDEAKKSGRGKKCVSMIPFVAALMFAVHPIHTESVSHKTLSVPVHLFCCFGFVCCMLPVTHLMQVAGVVGRAELTSAVCFLTALITYSHCCSDSEYIQSNFCHMLCIFRTKYCHFYTY